MISKKRHNKRHKTFKYKQYIIIFFTIITSSFGIAYSMFSETLTIAGSANSKAYTIVPLPGRIEAENYTNMYGVQTQATSDVDGVLNVGWIRDGDWTEYKVVAPITGAYDFTFRVACPNDTGTFNVLADGILLGGETAPNTGGFQTWTSITSEYNLIAGENTIRLNFTTALGLNINWLEISPIYNIGVPLPDNIEAEDYSSSNGVTTGTTTDGGGSQTIEFDSQGDWIEYEIYVPEDGSYNFDFRNATTDTRARLQMLYDGTRIINKRLSSTGGMDIWSNYTSDENLTAGEHIIRIYDQRNSFNINWINITKN